ncbi:MAG: hypothetical protein JWN93_1273 [Hyphomicrobiales bacterium]|jgi:hypothetical protein|nr:hypothetical protein [Hyphomicrobiales bacterium]
MASLSDSDKRILLGENYREIERQEQAASGISDHTRDATASMAKVEGLAMTCVFFAVVAAIIFSTNWFAVSGPYQPTLAMIAGVTFVVAVVAAVAAFTKRNQMRAGL